MGRVKASNPARSLGHSRKSKRSKPASESTPGRAYSVEFTAAAEVLREHESRWRMQVFTAAPRDRRRPVLRLGAVLHHGRRGGLAPLRGHPG
jgi:hypothetical protein